MSKRIVFIYLFCRECHASENFFGLDFRKVHSFLVPWDGKRSFGRVQQSKGRPTPLTRFRRCQFHYLVCGYLVNFLPTAFLRDDSSSTHETDMAAVAALSCPAPPRVFRCAKTLPAPSAATSSRGRVGYGSSYARRWQCRRWTHRPDATTTRIRRATPRRTAVVRVNCAYSPRGKGLVAADRSPWSFISHALLLLALVAYGGFTTPWKVP